MGTTLGINDDIWHGIIPAIAMLIVGIVTGFLISPKTSLPALVWLGSSLVLIAAQSINEMIQKSDPKRDEKYGSYENFLKNSKIDWRYFFIGWFIGSLLFAAGYMIVV